DAVTARSWNRVVDFARHLTRQPADLDLHELRKRAKRARYAGQLAAPVSGRSVRKLAKRLAAVQDALGAVQDTVIAEEWLRSLPLESLGQREAMTVGMLL